jgi:hypothetical protein
MLGDSMGKRMVWALAGECIMIDCEEKQDSGIALKVQSGRAE